MGCRTNLYIGVEYLLFGNVVGYAVKLFREGDTIILAINFFKFLITNEIKKYLPETKQYKVITAYGYINHYSHIESDVPRLNGS